MSLLKTVSEKLSAWRRYRETIRELAQLSDHELHDIGVHRGEIEYIARSSSAGKITARSSRTSSSTKPGLHSLTDSKSARSKQLPGLNIANG